MAKTARYTTLPLLFCCAISSAMSSGPAPPPIGIEQAIRRALEADSELRLLRLDHKLDEARFRTAVREFFPNLSISYSGLDSVTFAMPDARSRRLSVGFQQLVFGANRRITGRRLRRMELDIQRLALLSAAERTAVTVIGLFADYLRATQQTAIVERTFELTRDQVAIAAEELAQGAVSELQFLEIELMSRELGLELAKSRSERQRLLVRFMQLLRLDSSAPTAPYGAIDTAYRGTIDARDIERLRAGVSDDNLEVLRARAGTAAAAEQQRRARRDWIPDVRLNGELVSSADRFPLTQHGFSVGLTLAFALPLTPGDITVSAGRQSATERSRSVAATLRPGDNFDALYSRTAADIAVSRSRAGLDDLLRATDSAINELAIDLTHHRAALDILSSRRELEAQRAEIERLRLQLGEITRIAYLESQVARSRLEIDIARTVVALFQTEVALLQLAGTATFEPVYSRLFLAEE